MTEPGRNCQIAICDNEGVEVRCHKIEGRSRRSCLRTICNVHPLQPREQPDHAPDGDSLRSDFATLPPLSTSPSPLSPDLHSSPNLLAESGQHRSRASSASSTLTAGTSESDQCSGASLPPDLGDASQGVVVCLHRKMMPQQFYFLSGDKYSPSIFGIPLVMMIAIGETTSQDLYRQVWTQVARLVSPLPPQDFLHTGNHAKDCDDSLGYEYPFVLKTVTSGGCWCAVCTWDRMCRGCALPCTAALINSPSSFFAIDWDPTALHLRYLAAQERSWVEHTSVMESRTKATEPITLAKCLEAFTQEEDLGEEDKIHCAKCQSNQQVTKKLQIWRLPPILIFHLKRFQNVNSRWIKSHKIVDFPLTNLDSTNYLAAVPSETLIRHRELVVGRSMSRKRESLRSRNIGTIEENNDSIKNLTEDTVVDCDDPNDSGIETLERCRTDISDSAVFEADQEEIQLEMQKHKSIKQMPRTRQISTSLVKDPVKDDNLKDFHEHHLSLGCDPLDVRYKMYAMVCHSGVLGK